MTGRWVLLVCSAVAADALLGVAGVGPAGIPVVALSTVTGLALAGGPRVGMLTGFAVGTLLDLLAGPASLAGIHTIVGVALGAVSGATALRFDRRVRGAVMIGSLTVPAAAVLVLTLHGTHPAASTAVTRTVPWIALAGGAVTPLVLRVADRSSRRPLTNSASRA